MVGRIEDDGSQSLSPAQLIMPLVKALQEADDQNRRLNSKNRNIRRITWQQQK